MTKMSKTITDIEKGQIFISPDLSSEVYFTVLLQEGYARGFFTASEVESIQLHCLEFLAYKCKKYNGGESCSIRVEAAESIMKSNLYTIGLYLKFLADTSGAIEELKTKKISEIYQKGRGLITVKLAAAQAIYEQTQNNKLPTLNFTYNETLSEEGAGLFFISYKPDYEAHETPASIDYQLCNPVNQLTGVEFMYSYLENLWLENEFCKRFSPKAIHHLLCGYDPGYKGLLINIFEQVLTAALACALAKRSVLSLHISGEEIKRLHNVLVQNDPSALAWKIGKAEELVLEELNFTGTALGDYVTKSLPGILANISRGLELNTLDKIFVSPFDPDSVPKIYFSEGLKMNDEDYRQLIEELLVCRYPEDKLQLIKEQVKSFADLEDLLTDALLEEEEVFGVLDLLSDVEIAALIKRHPYEEEKQAAYMPVAEQTLRNYLNSYLEQLDDDRKKRVLEMLDQFADG
ncbi:MAG TPA: hypothetical protein GX523_10385 [Desulfitobacterium dehalogenans]|uniref:Uncharacterized protein n=1 Tax=Desulfitobacterium dehalogenans TaxID=36854 RepID=A0A7C6Z4N9_9FIRM|nr:hypothetical protein [Desulfitobacterium dehalogenans]